MPAVCALAKPRWLRFNQDTVKNVVFITGADTGAGKTVLTTLLLRHLRGRGVNALAVKPFCSGSRADARALRAAQDNLLTLDEINPYFFDKPVAPRAALAPGQDVPLAAAFRSIKAVSERAEVLLVEGSGGILAPLGKKYTAVELIQKIGCPVLVAARNQLGVINHAALTAIHLQATDVEHIAIILMGGKNGDKSCKTNAKMIRELTPRTPLFSVPELGKMRAGNPVPKKNVKFLKKTLARICDGAIFSLVRRGTAGQRINKIR